MSQRVLVVDDETMITTLIRRRLESEGYEVDECWQGADAVQKIKDSKFDAVLLDYSMPVMKGDEVCKLIREEPSRKGLPIIIMTAFTNRDQAFFVECGATDVVYKPIDQQQLFDVLRKHIPQ